MSATAKIQELESQLRALKAEINREARIAQAREFLSKHDLEVSMGGSGLKSRKLNPEDYASVDRSVGYDDFHFPVAGYDYGNGGYSALIVKNEESAISALRKYRLVDEMKSLFTGSWGNISSLKKREMLEELMKKVKEEWEPDETL